ncbi:MAG TPA: DUF805 domain-containing protein [Candidatus Nanopelagicales bacterium]|nr:DUF805 domain-containing protein [Candidatus Nanopelagicales bacterium]
MSFGQSVSYCLSNYANFNGRGRRSEFWWFYVFVVIVSAVVQGLLAAIFGADSGLYIVLGGLVGLALVIPLYAAGARRLHDTGKSGWLQLLVLIPCIGLIVLIVFWAQAGHPAENQYGAPVA